MPEIYCLFNSGNADNEMFDGEILDLSPSGLKLKTSKDLPITEMLYLEFGIINQISVHGDIRWKKDYTSYFVYGIHLQNDEDLQKQIISELKEFVKRNLVH